uniref:Uncharacterized protein n=1 Tax=Marseillevirus LCMAC101 TaxID=2506602 RepID=A0A481YR14_9VIRU|nr:MAG: hypothetical protein LCMAC101_02030 [Marseillevirus LCMAC101]
MHNPNIEYVTSVSPQGETPADYAQKHIKYIYWLLFIMLILLIFVILYAYLKGVPVKVR